MSDVHIDNASHFVTLTTNQWYYDQLVYGLGIEAPFARDTFRGNVFKNTYKYRPRPGYFEGSMVTVTPGARLTIGRGLHIDLGMDIGVGGSDAMAGQPINPQWAAQVALAYTFSPFVAETQVEFGKESTMGRISGCIIDAETSNLVQEAYVEFVQTDLPRLVVNDDACFSSPLLPAGRSHCPHSSSRV